MIRFAVQGIGKEPTKEYPENAGYDLFYAGSQSIILSPGERALLETDLFLDPSNPRTKSFDGSNIVGMIKPRSGLANKQGLDILGGVIDENYRDSLKIIVINLNFSNLFERLARNLPILDQLQENQIIINPGMKIAQIVFWEVLADQMIEDRSLIGEQTNRGTKGFGSSGV